MNVSFGLFPPLEDARGGRTRRRERCKGYTDRAKAVFGAWEMDARRFGFAT